jgi:DNA-binding GntR family transcriptional regulator
MDRKTSKTVSITPDLSMRVSTVTAPVRNQVLQILRTAIISGRFQPGQRLVEKELCEMIGVSRPSIREAMRQLESEKLIEIIPHRGPSVARLSVDDVCSIYQVRGALEALAASLFAQEATDEEIADLKKAVADVREAYDSGDVGRMLECKQVFYDILIEGSRNTVIRSTLSTLNDRINNLRRLSLSSPDRTRKSIVEIETILQAITQRDARKAFAASEAHVKEAAKAALQSIEQFEQNKESDL